MVELRKLELTRKDPRFTVGRTFRNADELRDWIRNGDYVHQTRKNGLLNVLRAVHDTIPEERAIVPPEQETRTTIEKRLKYGDEDE